MDIENLINTNWIEYTQRIDSTLYNMWNFILYNQFVNEEIRKLDIRNKILCDSIDRRENENDELRKEISELKKKVVSNSGKRKTSSNDSDEETCIKKVKRVDYLYEEYKDSNIKKKDKPRKVLNDELKDIFNKINSIEDIIEFENMKNKFDYINNKKFKKLYNLIPCLKELNNIIGMNDVKETIFKNICYFIHSLGNNNEMNHVMISGPPGVGKTTIAKIIGKIYLELGFLKNDNFITASRSDLIAKYLGQTAIKTQGVVDKALGGVLFIDEVYSLGNEGKSDSYAKECIDTLNLNMSRDDEPWLLIVGGYKDDIQKCFMRYNKGLERRFTISLEINSYTPEELFDIFKMMVKQDGWELCKDIDSSIIVKNKDLFKFYGGDMRKLFQKSKENNSLRLMKESLTLLKKKKNILILDDVKKGIEYFKDNTEKDEMDEYLRLSMYS